jgi:hypothetical protein
METPIKIDPQDARQGRRGRQMLYVLIVSFLLAVLVMSYFAVTK